jgi:hypothetical protein
MAAKIKPAFARDFSCAFIFRLGVDHEESAYMREAELIGFDYQGTGPTVFDPAVFAIGLGKKMTCADRRRRTRQSCRLYETN